MGVFRGLYASEQSADCEQSPGLKGVTVAPGRIARVGGGPCCLFLVFGRHNDQRGK